MKFIRKYLLSAVVTVMLMFAGNGLLKAQDEITGSEKENQTEKDVVEVINNSEEHTIFASLLEDAQVVDLLKQKGPYTVLAPTDEALENEELESIKQDPQRLQDFVVSHLFQGEVSSENVKNARNIEIKEGDIKASNGVVHFIDEVINSSEQ